MDLRLRSGSPVGHSASVGDAFGVVVDKTEENEERKSERAASHKFWPTSRASAIFWAKVALAGASLWGDNDVSGESCEIDGAIDEKELRTGSESLF